MFLIQTDKNGEFEPFDTSNVTTGDLETHEFQLGTNIKINMDSKGYLILSYRKDIRDSYDTLCLCIGRDRIRQFITWLIQSYKDMWGDKK
jgi:hypothetical protein